MLGDAYEPCPLLAEKVEAGNLGKKTGEGFYDYENGGADIPTDDASEDIVLRLVGRNGERDRETRRNDVAHAREIDEAVMLGAGFPEGPATMADDAGLDTLLETLESLHEETGAARYEPADYLEERAEVGGFADQTEDEGIEFEAIRIEKPGEMVGQIVLDRPHRMNTISGQLLDELAEAIDQLEEDDDVRAILITGEGDKAFSAGADVQSMAAGGADPIGAIDLSRKGQETFGKLESSPMPVVAGIDGYCLGGGMELSMRADLRIASEVRTRATGTRPRSPAGMGRHPTPPAHRRRGTSEGDNLHRGPLRPRDDGRLRLRERVVPTEEFENSAFELAANPPAARQSHKSSRSARCSRAGRARKRTRNRGPSLRPPDGHRRPHGRNHRLHGQTGTRIRRKVD